VGGRRPWRSTGRLFSNDSARIEPGLPARRPPVPRRGRRQRRAGTSSTTTIRTGQFAMSLITSGRAWRRRRSSLSGSRQAPTNATTSSRRANAALLAGMLASRTSSHRPIGLRPSMARPQRMVDTRPSLRERAVSTTAGHSVTPRMADGLRVRGLARATPIIDAGCTHEGAETSEHRVAAPLVGVEHDA
jgi:hypothetical protein